jgi:hypothetical protein
MDLITRMRNSERELKELIDRIAERQGPSLCSQVERAYLMRGLATRLAEMRTYIEDCLSGRNTHERSLLEYRVRIELPLYSHLDSLSGMSKEYVDWAAAEEAPQPAAAART